MNTFILMWNPAISSIKYREFKKLFRQSVATDFNWSVWDWKQAHAGDRFFMVRVGEEGLHGKGNGIVMSGHFTTEPYRGSDWSGKGREVYYMDLQPDYLFDTEKVRTLTDDFLVQSFPSFDWTKGHSGRMIPPEMAVLLEECWEKAVMVNADLLGDGRNWSIARDVFRQSRTVELFHAHYQGEIECVDAVFSGHQLDIYSYTEPYFDNDFELLPEVPDELPWDDIENYSIGTASLCKAFGVKDAAAAAKILRRDYSCAGGKRKLLEFAKKAGCKMYDSVILVD